MALFKVTTPFGDLVVDGTSAAHAKSKAASWINWDKNLADLIPPSGVDTTVFTIKPIGAGQITYGDRLWSGYGMDPGTLTNQNYAAVQANLGAGNLWNYKYTGPNDDGSADLNPMSGGSAGSGNQDLVDPVSGFLKGLGFNFGQGASASRDFQQRQGNLGAGTFSAQQAVDWFKDNIANDVQTQQGFASGLSDQGFRSGLANIGTNALGNLGTLSGYGNQFTGGEDEQRKFANPYSTNDLQSGDISSLLSAATQGAGVSSLYNRGPSQSDVMRMFTRFAGLNPTLGANSPGGAEDQNFLNYAANELGLSRFFNK
jgi:hypothetical protein